MPALRHVPCGFAVRLVTRFPPSHEELRAPPGFAPPPVTFRWPREFTSRVEIVSPEQTERAALRVLTRNFAAAPAPWEAFLGDRDVAPVRLDVKGHLVDPPPVTLRDAQVGSSQGQRCTGRPTSESSR